MIVKQPIYGAFAIAKCKHPVSQAVHIAQPVDSGGQCVTTVEIAAQRDGFLPVQAEEVLDVADCLLGG